ncbi:Spermine oxidase [Hypsibius exemplaris]|uniref:Spermine oxidase n=1 Tax=Hypsibius exemplaris TaxID=2072580 RepID=A0A1W0X221_HYPEX|nr:Spermine oxidase [Hypsibius exemplaris]
MAIFQQGYLTDDEKLAGLRGGASFRSMEESTDVQYARLFQPRIVIIGAGAAGLAAAEHLMENDFTNIVILEAQGRIGGRVWSQKIGQGHVEMGAQFIHGKNILYDVAEQNKLIKNLTPHKKKDVDPLSEHGSGGEFLVEGGIEVTPIMKAIFNDTYEAISTIFQHCKTGKANSVTDDEKQNVGRWMKQQFELYLAEQKNDSDDVKLFRHSILGWMMRVHRTDNACQSLYDLPVSEFAQYAANLECIPLEVPMLHILKLTLARAPINKVRLNKAVQQIRFTGQSSCPIEITCQDGDVVEADHCIVTASLGFLKHNIETFFQPQLSHQKVQAVKDAGFGTVNKIVLRFRQAFWEEAYGREVDGFQLLFSDMDDTESRLLDRPWHRAILGFDVCKTLPNTLVGWVCGQQAQEMETLTDDEVAEQCQTVLQTFLRATVVPRPVQVLRANWFHNQYVRGSYSYAAKDQAKNVRTIAEPCWYYPSAAGGLGQQVPGLLFAGEATHPTLFSTVPGAVESGQPRDNRKSSSSSASSSSLDSWEGSSLHSEAELEDVVAALSSGGRTAVDETASRQGQLTENEEVYTAIQENREHVGIGE